MASPADAVAVPQLNGLADPEPQSQPQSDHSQPADPSAKRKRETSDDGSAEPSINGNGNANTTHDPDHDHDNAVHASDHDDDDAKESKPIVNGDQPLRDESSLIRDYFRVLQRYATARFRHHITSHPFPTLHVPSLPSNCSP